MADYNGWSNYETWNVNLWIDNEEPWYRAKIDFLENLTEAVTNEDVMEFFDTVLFGTTPDLDQLREDGETIDPINFDEIAEAWEFERRELVDAA